MARTPVITQQRRDDTVSRTTAFCWIVTVCIVYVGIFLIMNNYQWYAYKQSSCRVVNNSMAGERCGPKYLSTLQFDAVWVVNVHDDDSLHLNGYLADIRQKFESYYEAYEATVTLYPVNIR